MARGRRGSNVNAGAPPAGGQVPPQVTMADDQLKSLIKACMESKNTSGLKKASATPAPTWGMPAKVDHPHFYKNNGDPAMTSAEWKEYFQTTLQLNNLQVNALRDEGIKYPIDFTKFEDEDTRDALFKSLKSRGAALSALTQQLIGQACDFF